MQQKRKLTIELEHPIDELQKLCAAIMILSHPGLSRVEIQQQQRIIDDAKEYHRLFRAYVKYLKYRVKIREQQFQQTERK